ncbi:interleukin 19 like [Genypterus blacodes]|uniref:interleukin 19 like n=1 Tax=Genypterus blacodes TaxID=154954 RepID=UPI003F75D79C
MKMLGGFAFCLLLLLSCLTEVVKSRSLNLNTCTVNVHTQELRTYYTAIRTDLIAEDSEIGVKLLDNSMIKKVQEGQTCCFMRLLLRFYIERVFSNYASAEPQHQRCTSALANAFVSIRRDIHQCHCHCDENTQRVVDSIHTEFIKLDIKKAALKAVGELDTLLDWMETVNQANTQA